MNVESFGVKYFKSNGNNVLKVNSLSNKAINFIKKNKNQFLDFDTYRTLEHCGPNNDDILNYRNEKELINGKTTVL